MKIANTHNIAITRSIRAACLRLHNASRHVGKKNTKLPNIIGVATRESLAPIVNSDPGSIAQQ